ncbi:hypothetical protein FRX31_003483 [Thalictrum thalictroides]|uniref:Uncharacterized protein n=1 Tax=Thalictrum thalictroides TaxID=46969 RepID=A0A7J6XDI9_THATH|nr:hypothetical protein FRX31_003483 [Thalictrum thalictroides]
MITRLSDSSVRLFSLSTNTTKLSVQGKPGFSPKRKACSKCGNLTGLYVAKLMVDRVRYRLACTVARATCAVAKQQDNSEFCQNHRFLFQSLIGDRYYPF